MTTHSIIILGTGMAGLAAGRLLKQAGQDVLLLDKGRRLGGRCATRRSEGYIFDHGAQFATAYGADFQHFIAEAAAHNALANWYLPKKDKPEEDRRVYIGQPVMRSVAEYMSNGLDIQQSVEITDIQRSDNLIALTDSDGTAYHCQHLICTAPAPQSTKLLAAAAPALSALAQQASYDPCWCVMLGWSHETHPDLQEKLKRLQQPCARLDMAVPQHMRKAAETKASATDKAIALVLQASPAWSKTHLEAEKDFVISRLTQAYHGHLDMPLPAAEYSAAHRWRYARVQQSAGQTTPFAMSADGQIMVAGDWLAGPRLEAAYDSGVSAARQLLAQLS